MATPSYADLEIRIRKLEDTDTSGTSGYPVELTLDDHLAFEDAYLSPEILPWTSEGDAAKDGERLFRWFLADDQLQRQWAQIHGKAPQRRIRLRIDSDAPELHALPWELLRDSLTDNLADTLAADADTPFSRYLSGAWEPLPTIKGFPIRLLVAIANPEDLTEYGLNTIDVDVEKTIITDALGSIQRDQIELTFIDQAVTLSAIEQALREHQPHLLHIVAHGQYSQRQNQAQLYLADEANQVSLIEEVQLADMLQRSSHMPHLVFLASCQTATRSPADAFRGMAPTLIEAGIPAVVAMQDRVSAETAQAFSQTFYRQLLRHGQIDLACNEARSTLMSATLPGSQIPVLFSRLIDNQLFALPSRATQRYLIAGVSVAIVAILAMTAWLFLRPLGEMSGLFNIAVVEFGKVDADNSIQRSTRGQALSQWLYEGLQAELTQPDITLPGRVDVWHDSIRSETDQTRSLGYIQGATLKDRREAVASLAEEINAHMIIYGNLVPSPDGDQLVLEFYLSPQINNAIKDDTSSLIGVYQVGSPLPLPPEDQPDIASDVFVSEQLAERSGGLFWLVIGLTQTILGKNQEALDTFLRAERALAENLDGIGQDTLHFFIGREQLALGQHIEAEESFRQALQTNSNFVRAEIALGTALFQQAIQIIDMNQRLAEPNLLEKAQQHQATALTLALDKAEPFLEALARVALSNTYWATGETHLGLADHEQAATYYNLALTEARQAGDLLANTRQYRLMAQSYEVQERTHLQYAYLFDEQGDLEGRQAQLDLAKTAHDLCIAQGDKNRQDAFLQEIIIEQNCKQAYLRITGLLQKSEEE